MIPLKLFISLLYPGTLSLKTWMKAFRIFPEFRILRLTFHRLYDSLDLKDLSFDEMVEA